MPTPQKPMAIKLPDSDRTRLKRLADVKKRSSHWLAKEAIAQYLNREEAVERFREETRNRWEEYRQTGSTVSNEAIMEWLESWGSDNEKKVPL